MTGLSSQFQQSKGLFSERLHGNIHFGANSKDGDGNKPNTGTVKAFRNLSPPEIRYLERKKRGEALPTKEEALLRKGARSFKATDTVELDKRNKQTKQKPQKNKEKKERSWKENLKVLAALNFNLVVPIASTFLWALGPVGLLGIPISYVSGKIGQKLMDSVDTDKASGMAEKFKIIDDHMNNADATKAETIEKLKAEGQINDNTSKEEVEEIVGSHQADVIDSAIDELIEGILNIKYIPVVTGVLKWVLQGKMAPYIKGYFRNRAKRAGGAAKFAFRANAHLAATKSGNNSDGVVKTAKNIGKASFQHFIFWRLDDVLVGFGATIGGPVGLMLRGVGTALRWLLPMVAVKDTVKDVRQAKSAT